MCGFVLVAGRDGWTPPAELVHRMASALVHRGPDGSGYLVQGRIGIGFRRLAILDLSDEGKQPMLSADGRYALVFNGEIFNYLELRQELTALGHRFRSTGDTEVLLAAWLQWGEKCLLRLNGMFAFAITDLQSGEVVGARDRFGIKPLFVHHARAAVLLASEIKAIVASGMYRHETDERVAAKYLVDGHLDDSTDSFYVGISSVPAAHSFRIRPDGHWHVTRWWSMPSREEVSPDDAPAQFAELFEDAVRLRMRSDVPVGVCLSGGLDSTSILCAMARQRVQMPQRDREPLRAFAYMAAEFDESMYVRDTIATTSAELVPLQSSEVELWHKMERVLHFQDEPVHSMSAVVGYGLMELARAMGTTVVLNGQGADEYLAGYSTYFQDYWFTLMERGETEQAAAELETYAQVHGSDATALRRALSRRVAFSRLGRFPGYRTLARIASRAVSGSPLFSSGLVRAARNGVPEAGNLTASLRASVTAEPLPLYLRVEDRNAMAHSIEARVPFLDWRLVEFATRLPPEWKIRGPWNKYILREAMRGRIPESVRARSEKMGFPTPSPKWFAHQLYEPVRDLLASTAARERGFYRTDRLLHDLDARRGREVDFAGPLFRVAQFEQWCSMVASRKTPPETH